MSYFYLDQRALEKLREFFASQPEVVFAAVLGSLASRGFSFHDVDVAVKLMCEDKYAHLSRILDSVAKLFGSDLGSIDLVDLDRADVGLKKRVITEGLVLVDKGYVKEVVEELSNILPEYDEYLSLSIREWLTSRDPTSIDLELIKKRVGFIKSEVSFLKEHVLSKSPLEVSGSPILKRLLERSYHLVVEAFVDICRHIASVKGWRPSFTAREFIESCGSHGVINGELSSRLIEALKLRNIIIHRYMEIDYDRLYAEARSLVRLAEDFEKQLIAFLKKEAQQP